MRAFFASDDLRFFSRLINCFVLFSAVLSFLLFKTCLLRYLECFMFSTSVYLCLISTLYDRAKFLSTSRSRGHPPPPGEFERSSSVPAALVAFQCLYQCSAIAPSGNVSFSTSKHAVRLPSDVSTISRNVAKLGEQNETVEAEETKIMCMKQK